jgi:signal transduction histidine kinase
VDVNSLVHKIADNFADLAAYREISLDIIESGKCSLLMNPDLATVMIANLVKNSIVHNNPGGRVTVTIRGNELSVENNNGTGSLDGKKIFDRFYKERQSNSSTGLGLSIVKAIAELYGYKLSYSFQNSHVFTISF